MIRAAIALLVLAWAPALHAAQIYRCSQGSAVSYQETPCAGASLQHAWAVPEFPSVNAEARERLLRREAALEARLARRLEIEAAERIARENRRAREFELAAERERARAAELVHVVPFAVRPYRHPRPPRHTAFGRH